MCSTFRYRDNMVNLKRFLFTATQTAIIIFLAQVKPLCFCNGRLDSVTVRAALESVNSSDVSFPLNFFRVIFQSFTASIESFQNLVSKRFIIGISFSFLFIFTSAILWIGCPLLTASSIIPFVDR